jgi:hypothetical protein
MALSLRPVYHVQLAISSADPFGNRLEFLEPRPA